MISIIAAHTANFGIGKDNQLLFHFPEDLRRFKQITMGKPIVMGRKTFQSIGRPLPGRENIIISKSIKSIDDFGSDVVDSSGCKLFDKLDKGLEYAREWNKQQETTDKNNKEIMIIGGADIYAQTIEKAERMYITEICETVEDCDAFFPKYESNDWQVINEEPHLDNDIPYIYRKLQIKDRKAYNKTISSKSS